jgi:hypothetical protein
VLSIGSVGKVLSIGNVPLVVVIASIVNLIRRLVR